MQIKVIDRAALKAIQPAALSAVQAALSSFGITATLGRCVFSNGAEGELKFKLVAAGADPERERFERCAGLFGLTPSDYGRAFTLNGLRYKLCGIDPGRPKFPISGERVPTGSRFKFTERAVRDALAHEPAA